MEARKIFLKALPVFTIIASPFTISTTLPVNSRSWGGRKRRLVIPLGSTYSI